MTIGRRQEAQASSTGATDGRLVGAALVALLVALALKVMLMRAQVLGSVLPRQGVMRDWFFVGLLLAPALLFWRRRPARIALVVCAVLLSTSMAATTVYERYFDEVPSLKTVQLAGQVGEVGGSVGELLDVSDALFFIDLPVLGLLLFSKRRASLAKTPPGELMRGVAAMAVAGTLIVTGVVSVVRMPGMLNGTSVSGGRGVFTYQVASLWHTERLSSEIDVDPGLPASVIATIAELKGPAPAERAHPDVARGAAAGANLIVVQCEALQTFLVDAEADGREVTPNLNALVRESWYFPRTFAQIAGGNTADAEWVSNTSLYPPTNEPASVRWQDRAVPSLPRVLRQSGYLAETFHTNDASFWNRRNLYAALGFDRYYDRDFFGTDDEITFGSPSDEHLFARTLEVLEGHARRGQRFYAQIVTMSAHHPFRPLPARKRPVDFGEPYSGTVVGRYLSNQEYADRALGRFIDGLKASGLWETSVVIVYGDHFGLGELDPQGDEKVAIETLLGRPYTVIDRLNVPLVIHLPGQTEGVLATDTAAQMDIAPTVLDLLGIDPGALPLFGRSLFAGGPAIAGLQRSAPVGSYAGESALVMPDGEQGAVAVPLDDPFSRRPATPEETARLKVASELMVLSAEYCDALPVRPDFAPDAKMDIPK